MEVPSLSRRSLEFLLWAVTLLQRRLLGFIHQLRYRLGIKHLYKPRPEDIFLVTYPKSGTTLMQMMLYQMTSDGEMDFPHIYSISPWFEMDLRRGATKEMETLPSPRFFKSHLVYEQLPPNARFIYVARDVQDVAVSAYHHFILISGKNKHMEEFLNDFLQEKVSLGSWFKHIESWWPRRNDPNVLFLHYEEVIADLAGTVREVARFCQIPLDEVDLPRIVERCGIEFMKQHAPKFDPRLHQASQGAGTFIRKGGSGEGRLSFNPKQNQMLASRMKRLARKLGPDRDANLLLRPSLDLDRVSDG
jgi:hypothetical protein